jgi:hypothetical protein
VANNKIIHFFNQYKPTKIKTSELTLSASSVICWEFQCCSPHIPPTVGFYFHFRTYQTVPLTIKKKYEILRQIFKSSTFPWFLVFFIVTLSIFDLLEVFFHFFYFLFCERERLCPEEKFRYIIYIEGKLSFKNPDCDLFHCTLSILNCEWRC